MSRIASSFTMKLKQSTQLRFGRIAAFLLGGVVVAAGLGGCGTTPLVPAMTGRSEGRSAYLEKRAIDDLLRMGSYREAFAKAVPAVELHPRDEGLRQAFERAQEGVARLDAGPATADQVLARMATREDQVEGNRWYRHQYREGRSGTRMDVYLGQSIDDPSRVWMRLTPRFESRNWLFVDGFTVVANGHRYDKDNQRFKRDHFTRGVVSAVGPRTTTWEWVDLPVGQRERDMIEAVIRSSNAVLRFRGENTIHDYTFTEMDRVIYQDMLAAFDELRGGQE